MMVTKIRKIDEDSLKEAEKILFSHGVIGMPTETVYGLAGIGTDTLAVKEIFNVKGRPTDNPLIAHVHKDFDIESLVQVEQQYVYNLMQRFMPGPLTLVMKSKGVICSEAVCGGNTLALRMPSHSGCQRFLKFINAPIVAPSANISKHTSPVTAQHVYNDLQGKIPLILDGGKCVGGIESTVLDVTEKVPRILRAGLVTKEMIAEVVGACEVAEHKDGDKIKSPGVKYRHYRPKCDAVLFEANDLAGAVNRYKEETERNRKPYIMAGGSVCELLKQKGVTNILNLGNDGKEIAFNLYDKLLEGEKIADIIIAIDFGRIDGVYLGITNRLRKSCG